MRIYLVTLIFYLLFTTTKSQGYFAKYMIVGTSVTHVRNSAKEKFGDIVGYDELTWNSNIGIQIHSKTILGMQLLNIYTSDLYTSRKYYTVYGIFSQYNFLKHKKKRLFAELSINKGNYFVGKSIPYQIDGLYYLGFGAGYDMSIKKIPNLYIDLSFLNYYILNKISDKIGYTQYIIGLNYRFHER